jgi:hypothetical protein
MLRAGLVSVKARSAALPRLPLFLCYVQVEQKLCRRVHVALKLAQLRFVVVPGQRAKKFLELLDVFHRRSVVPTGQSRKARKVALGASPSGPHTIMRPSRGAQFLSSFIRERTLRESFI